MGLCSPLRELADFVEEIERSGREVTSLDFPDPLTGETELSTEIELALPFGEATGDRDGLSFGATDIEPDGSLRLELETAEAVVPSTPDDVEVEIRRTAVRPDGKVAVALSVSVSDDVVSEPTDAPATSPNGGSPTSRDDDASGADPNDDTSAPSPSSVRPDTASTARNTGESETGSSAADGDVPPFRDRELLAEVYESCETFAEMTDALDMDVTAETVRRYMIEHDIHEAATYDTTTDGEEETPSDGPTAAEPDARDSPVVLADGSGLVEDVDIDTLIEVVRESRTIYEVKQKIGLEREDAVDMLRRNDLLDLIAGRLAEHGRTEVTREEIVDRLREGSAAG